MLIYPLFTIWFLSECFFYTYILSKFNIWNLETKKRGVPKLLIKKFVANHFCLLLLMLISHFCSLDISIHFTIHNTVLYKIIFKNVLLHCSSVC